MLIEELNHADDTFVITEPDNESLTWFASMSLLEDGTYEMEWRDMDRRDHEPTIETDRGHIAEELTNWLAACHNPVRPDAIPRAAHDLFRNEPRPPVPAVEILHAVAMALFMASARTHDVTEVLRTFALLSEALESAPEGAVQPAMTFNHGSVCLELSRLNGDRKAAMAAVVLMRQAIAAIPDGEPVPPDMLRVLAAAQREAPLPQQQDEGGDLIARAARDPALLDRTIAVPTSQTSNMTAAGAADDGDPELVNLANLFRIRFESSGELDDVDRAIEILRRAAGGSRDAEIRRGANTVSSAAHLARAVSSGL